MDTGILKRTAHIEKAEIIRQGWLCLGPFAALTGNAGSDIWLSATAVFFLIASFRLKNWRWIQEPWFCFAFAFWAWAMFAALTSSDPLNSFETAVPWIRFPIFVFGFVFLIGGNKDRFRHFIFAALAATALMCCLLLFEKFQNPALHRLQGPWGQDSKAGWFLFGIGLPAVLGGVYLAQDKLRPKIFAFAAILALLIVTILNGQIYMTFIVCFGIGIFLIAQEMNIKTFMIATAIFGAAVAIALIFPSTFNRFYHAFSVRLPWFESSDYYMPWVSGIMVGLGNFFTGVGAGNFGAACDSLIVMERDFPLTNKADCFGHPHQLFIQYFAETGIIGLMIFVVMLLLLFAQIISIVRSKASKPLVGFCVALGVVIIWPISTYSDAFGQHMNFFTWMLIAIATTAAGSARKSTIL